MQVFKRLGLAALLLCIPLTTPATADSAISRSDHTEVQLVAATQSVTPGATIDFALRMRMDDHWHTYWINPGDAGLETRLRWTLPEGWQAGEILWPTPMTFDLEGIVNYGYEGEIFLIVPIKVSTTAAPDSDVTVKLRAEWLECDDICKPGSADLALTIPVTSGDDAPSDWAAPIAESRANLPQPLPEWEAQAWFENEKFTVILRNEEATHDPSPVTFYSVDAQINPDSPQPAEFNDGQLVIELTKSRFAQLGTSLPGVIAAANGWDPQRPAVALAVNPEIQKGPAPAMVAQTATPAPRLSLLVILGAFVGGLILNLMPCVFPVIGIKIMGFVNQAGETRGHVVLHGLVFSLGVLVSFWALAGVLIALRSGGEQLGWGFQLQSPAFVLVLTFLLFIFALCLSGLFDFGVRAMGVGSKLSAKSGLNGTFFSGILATVVATPCAAPFLAPALGVALALPPIDSIVVFTAIAIGLATPYLLLSAFPAMISLLPKPGAWMETFKQLMAFPLYATVGYLIWVLAGQVDASRFLNILFALVLVAMACWVYGRYGSLGRPTGQRAIGISAAALLLASGVALSFHEEHSDIDWQPWSTAAVEEMLDAGRPVYIDFTARWCATCQVNKRVAFSSAEVVRLFRQNNVATFVADWTNHDPAITDALAQYGRSAVPFNIIYFPDRDEPVILPEILTPDIVINRFKSGL